jgi:hypothetical protein
MRLLILPLAAFAVLATVFAATAEEGTFGEFDCTIDCSGHAAGFRWAESHGVDSEDDCPDGNSQSFHDGCIAYTQDPSIDPETEGQPNMDPDDPDKDDE